MPRQDWRNDDDFMIRDDRERSRGDYRDRSRDYGGYDDHVARCEAHFRSYDASTDLYLGYDGEYHRCPL